MDNNKIDSANSLKRHADKAKRITLEKLIDFLNQFGFSDDIVKCSVCGGHDFTIPVGADRGDGIKYPLIITTPIPNESGMGVWHFPILCKKCSNTLMFNVGYLADLLEKEGKLGLNNV